MSTKKVSIGAKPTAKAVAPSADQWVDERKPQEKEVTKRLTFDVPASLHAKIKSSCAMRGTKMVEEITALLTEKFNA
jgi:hypothetical protein